MSGIQSNPLIKIKHTTGFIRCVRKLSYGLINTQLLCVVEAALAIVTTQSSHLQFSPELAHFSAFELLRWLSDTTLEPASARATFTASYQSSAKEKRDGHSPSLSLVWLFLLNCRSGAGGRWHVHVVTWFCMRHVMQLSYFEVGGARHVPVSSGGAHRHHRLTVMAKLGRLRCT